MQLKPRRRRLDAASASNNAASHYRALQSRVISDSESKTSHRQFMRAKEAASWLGIPLRSLHQYVQQGLLPSYKLGRHRLFRQQELLDALGASRVASRAEILR
jgi:excisionase family DNA binding protein